MRSKGIILVLVHLIGVQAKLDLIWKDDDRFCRNPLFNFSTAFTIITLYLLTTLWVFHSFNLLFLRAIIDGLNFLYTAIKAENELFPSIGQLVATEFNILFNAYQVIVVSLDKLLCNICIIRPKPGAIFIKIHSFSILTEIKFFFCAWPRL